MAAPSRININASGDTITYGFRNVNDAAHAFTTLSVAGDRRITGSELTMLDADTGRIYMPVLAIGTEAYHAAGRLMGLGADAAKAFDPLIAAAVDKQVRRTAENALGNLNVTGGQNYASGQSVSTTGGNTAVLDAPVASV